MLSHLEDLIAHTARLRSTAMCHDHRGTAWAPISGRCDHRRVTLNAWWKAIKLSLASPGFESTIWPAGAPSKRPRPRRELYVSLRQVTPTATSASWRLRCAAVASPRLVLPSEQWRSRQIRVWLARWMQSRIRVGFARLPRCRDDGTLVSPGISLDGDWRSAVLDSGAYGGVLGASQPNGGARRGRVAGYADDEHLTSSVAGRTGHQPVAALSGWGKRDHDAEPHRQGPPGRRAKVSR